jgi:hypothetical protein
MGLRLVHDANVESLPVYNVRDMGAMARELGDMFDEGEFGQALTFVALIISDEGLRIKTSGENPNGYQLMGIFEAAKHQCFAADMTEEDE